MHAPSHSRRPVCLLAVHPVRRSNCADRTARRRSSAGNAGSAAARRPERSGHHRGVRPVCRPRAVEGAQRRPGDVDPRHPEPAAEADGLGFDQRRTSSFRGAGIAYAADRGHGCRCRFLPRPDPAAVVVQGAQEPGRQDPARCASGSAVRALAGAEATLYRQRQRHRGMAAGVRRAGVVRQGYRALGHEPGPSGVGRGAQGCEARQGEDHHTHHQDQDIQREGHIARIFQRDIERSGLLRAHARPHRKRSWHNGPTRQRLGRGRCRNPAQPAVPEPVHRL